MSPRQLLIVAICVHLANVSDFTRNKSKITIRKYTQIHKSGIAIDADSIIMKGASLRANCEQVNKFVALDLRDRETEVICYAMSRVIFINKQKVNK